MKIPYHQKHTVCQLQGLEGSTLESELWATVNIIQLTFFEGLVDTGLSVGKTFVSFNVREHPALVYPIVVMRTKEEHREVPQVMLKALDVQWHRPGIADLCWPPPKSKNNFRARTWKSHYSSHGCQEGRKALYFIDSKDTKYLAYVSFLPGLF